MNENSDTYLHQNKIAEITIILPCYNSGTFIPRAIDSVLAQTWVDFELLIVDDGSSDQSFQIANEYGNRDQRIRILRHDRNRGLPAARNTGIQYARGNLIAFLDADDWWAPDKLAFQVPVFNDQAFGACCVTAILVFEDIQFTQKSPQAFINPDTLYQALLFGNVIPGSASSMVVRKQCFEKLGLFNDNMIAAEDQDMWIRLAQHYPIYWIDSPLVYIDKSHPGAMTKTIARMARGREQFLNNRKRDIRAECRHLLPRAIRHTQIHTAIEYLRANDLNGTRGHAWKAITASIRIDRELRRAFLLYILSWIPIPTQRLFLHQIRRRLLKTSE